MTTPRKNPALDKVRREVLRQKAWLRERGVGGLFVFGSVVRGEAGPLSDVDLLVERAPGAALSLYDVAEISRHFERVFKRKVDVLTWRGLNDEAADRVRLEALRVF
jgi:predicted nucleotidyltransferase